LEEIKMNEKELNSYGEKILPWLRKKMNVEGNRTCPIVVMSDEEIKEFFGGDGGGFAAYAPAFKMIFMSEEKIEQSRRKDKNDAYVKSAIVHELTHFLQHESGRKPKPSEGVHKLEAIELEAYTMQACFLWEKLGIEPERLNLGESGIKKGAAISTLNAVLDWVRMRNAQGIPVPPDIQHDMLAYVKENEREFRKNP
jgi:hypothetical protein